jgi:putative sigma-54 modulation protein
MNETNTTPLPIHITPHHLRLSSALSKFVRDKFAKIPRFANDVLATDIVLRRHHGTSSGKQFSASARLALAGRDIHASAMHADLYSAIVKLVATLARRSRKRKVRLERSFTTPRGAALFRPQQLPSHSQPQGVAKIEAAPGEVRNANRRTGGQEQRVFRFRRTAPFAFTKCE